MSIFRSKRKKYNFTVLDNTVIQDTNLSMAAMGLHTYLMHLPVDWKVNISHLLTRFKDKRDAIRSKIKELEKAGYIRKHRITRENGTFIRWDYDVFEEPQIIELSGNEKSIPESDNPISDNPISDNPKSDKPQLPNTNINKNTNKNKELNKKYESLARLLYKKNIENDPKAHKGKDIDKMLLNWSNDIRLLVEKDGRTEEEIESVIKWCQDEDNFPGNFSWVPNIKSGKKLRKHFSTMFLQSQRKNGKKKTLSSSEQRYLDELKKSGFAP